MKPLRLPKFVVFTLLALALAAPALAQKAKTASEQRASEYADAVRADISPKLSPRFSRDLKKMSQLADKEQFAELLALAEKMAADPKAKPADIAAAHQNAAYAAMEMDDYETGLRHLEGAIAADALPNETHYPLMLQIIQIRIQEEQYEQGLAMLERFMQETRTRKPDHLALKGNALYRLDRLPEAEAALREAIQARADAPDSWRQMLMATLIEQEKDAEAAQVAVEIAARNPDDKRAQMNLAATFAQTDQLDRAAEVLEGLRAKGMFSEERDYRQLYAIYLNSDNKEREAIAVINEGLAKGVLPASSEVYTALAQAYYFTDQIDKAIDAYRKAAPLAKDGEAGLNLARVLSNEEHHAESKAAAQEALAKGLRRPGDAWIVIARAEFGLNNRNAMIAAYREAAKYPETREQAESWLKRSGLLK